MLTYKEFEVIKRETKIADEEFNKQKERLNDYLSRIGT